MTTLFSGARASSPRRSWVGAAFILEALVLLVFIAASLAILFRLFAGAYAEGGESSEEAMAVLLASNAAEAFAADPQAVDAVVVEGDLLVSCKVTEEARSAGTFFHADIAVRSLAGDTGSFAEAFECMDPAQIDGLPLVYQLETARYARGLI